MLKLSTIESFTSDSKKTGSVPMGKFIDLTGQRFGRLTVLQRDADRVYPNGSIAVKWLCQCDCGRKVVVFDPELWVCTK